MTLRKGIPVSDLLIQEQGTLKSGMRSSIVFQQVITSWLTTQLNTSTQKMPAPNYRCRHLK